MSNCGDELAAKLMDSYAEIGGINHIDGVNLPSKQGVGEIVRQLLRLLFPGFYQKEEAEGSRFEKAIRDRIQWVCENLGVEISKSMEFCPPASTSLSNYEERAEEITKLFMSKLPHLRELLSADVEAAYDGDPASKSYEEIILAYPGLEAIAVQRLAHELFIMEVALIPRMMTEWAHSRTGIDIHPGAQIGASFFIDHGTGVVIGETTEIGNHVKIYHGVTLGARSTSGGQQLRGKKRHPTIEDHVTIYPGATILGGETVIGKGSTVNGNVFLLESVPPDSRVAYEEHTLVIKPKRKREE